MVQPVFEKAERLGIARAEIVEAYQRYVAAAEAIGARPSILGFVGAYNTRKITVDQTTRKLLPNVDRTTLTRWLLLSGDASPENLVPRWKGQVGLFDRRPELRTVAEAILAEHPDAGPAELRRLLEARLPRHKVPSLRTIQRQFHRLLKSA